MNLQPYFHQSSSRSAIEKLVALLKVDTCALQEVLHILRTSDLPVKVYQAAWALSILGDECPALLVPFRLSILEYLVKEPNADGVLRNLIRIFKHQKEYSEEEEGLLINFCFNMLANPRRGIAVRSFSMELLCLLSQKYPALKQELRATTEDIMRQPDLSPGLKSRGLKTLLFLRK